MPTRKNRTPEENKDRRLELADRLIELMEKGEAHWQKPWVARAIQPPTNAVTGKPYRGVNAEYLFAFSPDPTDNRWCTYKQAQEQGWQVRKGEHALAFIEKYTPYERKPTEEERQNRIAQGGDPDAPVQSISIRHYPVFHASQIDGIPPLERGPQPEMEGKPDPRIEKLAEEMGVQVTRSGGRAFYRSLTDTVNLPPVEAFHTATGHDTTFLHELSHATGHESRLNRELGHPFGSEKYALEELRAEMSAAMTAASLGIGFDPASQELEEGREVGNSAAYLASWLSALPDKERKQILMQTIKDAQAMSDFLLERTPELQVEAPERAEPDRGVEQAPGVLFESDQHRITEDRMGNLTLSRLRDGKPVAEVYLQGDDAHTLREDLEKLGDSPTPRQREVFDHGLTEYHGVMTPLVQEGRSMEGPGQQQVRGNADVARLILTHRKDLEPHEEQEVSADGLRMEVTRSIPAQSVRGPLLNISQSAYYIGTQEYGPVWVETGFRIGELDDPVVQFAREAIERRAEVVLSVSNDGLVTTLEDANTPGRAYAATHEVPARPLALMDEVRHLNAPKLAPEERMLRGTLMEVYDTNQVEVLDPAGKHIYASAAGPAERSLEDWKALRGKEVSVSADDKGYLQVAPAKEINPEIVAHLEERNRVRQSAHPDYAGLGDPVANAEDFTTRFAQRNPMAAREWSEAIRADMPGYSEAAGLTPASLALIASQMEAGARRMEHPRVGDLVRFEPHDKDPLRGGPFSGRVIAALDTNTGDTRYHLRAETGPDQSPEHPAPSPSHDPAPVATIRGRDGTRYALSLREKDGEVLAKLEIAGGETAEAPLQPFRSAKIPDTEKLAARMELSDGRTLAVRLSPGNSGVEADLLSAEGTFNWKRLNDAPGKLRADGVNSPEAKWVAERLGVDVKVMQRPELAAGVGGYRAPEKTREQARGMDR